MIVFVVSVEKRTQEKETADNLTTCSANSFLLADGVCDDIVNNKRCFFDKGDCCLGTEESLKYCENCTCMLISKSNLVSQIK